MAFTRPNKAKFQDLGPQDISKFQENIWNAWDW